MRSRPFALCAGLVAFVGVAGAMARPPAPPRPIPLMSSTIVLPADESGFPDGPQADVLRRNCLSCHSAEMVLTQPALSPAQWQAIVAKMRDAYHAPVAEADVPAILASLATLPGQRRGR